MAQTEIDWRREQEKALQSDNDLEIKEPEWAYILQLAGQLKRANDLQEKWLRTVVCIATFYALLILYLVWKAVQL